MEQGKAPNLVGLLRYRKTVLFVPFSSGDWYQHLAIVAVVVSITVTVTFAVIYIPMAV